MEAIPTIINRTPFEEFGSVIGDPAQIHEYQKDSNRRSVKPLSPDPMPLRVPPNNSSYSAYGIRYEGPYFDGGFRVSIEGFRVRGLGFSLDVYGKCNIKLSS